MAGDTHYDVLGVEPVIDAAHLRKAYVGLARKYHPDFHTAGPPEARAHAESRMRAVNAAWEVLGSPQARAKYDKDMQGKGRLHESGPGRSPSNASTAHYRAPDKTSGTAPPRWLTMLPALCLILTVACFAIGMVTGLAVMFAGAIGLALVGGLLFAFVPMVALKRASRSAPDGPTARV